MTKSVLIVGAGLGLSSSLAKCCAHQSMKVALAARNLDKLEAIARETNAELYQCDASSVDDVAELFARLDASIGTPEMVIYNPSSRVHGPVQELDPVKVQDALNITCYGAFLVAQQAAQRMLVQGHGSIFFTGATAGIKGFANSSVFAMGKFGLRGLAQSMARELHPQNVHVVHVVVDGGIRNTSRGRVEGPDDDPDKWLDPDAIAETYYHLHTQHQKYSDF